MSVGFGVETRPLAPYKLGISAVCQVFGSSAMTNFEGNSLFPVPRFITYGAP
jgi:hypothetical protein